MKPPPTLTLGLREDGSPLQVPLDLLSRHVLLRAVSGAGKSRLLEALLIELLGLQRQGTPLSLIMLDPVGEVYGALTEHLASLALSSTLAAPALPPGLRHVFQGQVTTQLSKVRLLDFLDPDTSGLRHNPLEKPPYLSVSETVGDLLRSIERVVGSLSDMRRLANVIRCVAQVLVETGASTGVHATVHDMLDFLLLDSPTLGGYLENLAKRSSEGSLRVPVRPDFIRRYLSSFFIATSPRERRELVQSSLNLISIYIAEDRSSTFLSSPRGNLDLEAVINDGGVLLVRLPAGVDAFAQRSLGSLIANRIELISRRRDVARVKAGGYPLCVLTVDEAHDFLSPSWASTVAQARNYGLALVLSHQTRAQFESTPEMESLLQCVEANTAIKVLMRLELEDAIHGAHRVFRPRGTMLVREETEVTQTTGTTCSRTVTDSITRQVSQALATSQTETLSMASGTSKTLTVGKAKGVTSVNTDSCSIATGEGWSQVRTRGLQITQTQSTTHVQGSGRAEGESESSSQSEAQSTADNNSASTFMGEGVSLPVGLDLALTGGGGGGGPSGRSNSSHGSSRGSGSSNSSSLASSLARAASLVVSESQALARAQGESRGLSHSTARGRSGSKTRTVGESVSRGLSQVESLARALGESVTRTEGRSQGLTATRGRGESIGRSVSEGTGHSVSTSTKQRRDYYNVADEAMVRSYELTELPPRTAWVLLRGAEATRIRTVDVAGSFPTSLAGVSGWTLLADFTRPRPPEPLPDLPIHQRLAVAPRFVSAEGLSFAAPSAPGERDATSTTDGQPSGDDQ